MPAAVVFPMLSHLPTNQTFFRPWVDSKQTSMGYLPNTYQHRPQRPNVPRPSRQTPLDGPHIRRPLNVPHTERQISNTSYQNRPNCSSNHDRQVTINGSGPERHMQPYPPYRGRQADWTNNNVIINTCQPPPSNSSQQSTNYAFSGQASSLPSHSPYATSQYQDYQPSSVLFVPLYTQFHASQVQETNSKSPRQPIMIQDPHTKEVITDKLLNEARSTRSTQKIPQSRNSVAAEFATKVAAVAIEPNSECSRSNSFSTSSINSLIKNEISKNYSTKSKPPQNADEIKAEFARKVAAVAHFSGTKKTNPTVTGSSKPALNSSVGYSPVIPPQSTMDQPVQPSLDACMPQYPPLQPTPQYYGAPAEIPYFALSHHTAPLGTVYYPSPPPPPPLLSPVLHTPQTIVNVGGPVKETKAVKIQDPNTLKVLNNDSKPTETAPKVSEITPDSSILTDIAQNGIDKVPEHVDKQQSPLQELVAHKITSKVSQPMLKESKTITPPDDASLEIPKNSNTSVQSKMLCEENKSNGLEDVNSNQSSLSTKEVNDLTVNNDSKLSDSKFRTVGVQCSPGLTDATYEANSLHLSKISMADSLGLMNGELNTENKELEFLNEAQDQFNVNEMVVEQFIKGNGSENSTVNKMKVENAVFLNKENTLSESASTLSEEKDLLQKNSSILFSEKQLTDVGDSSITEEIDYENKDSSRNKEANVECAKLPLLDDMQLLTKNLQSDGNEQNSSESEIVQKSKDYKKTTNKDLKLEEPKVTSVRENKIVETPVESEMDTKNEEMKQQKENEKKSKHETELTPAGKQSTTSETSPTLTERIHSLIKNVEVDFTPSYMKGRLPEGIKETKGDRKTAHNFAVTENVIKDAEKNEQNGTLKPQTLLYEKSQWSPHNPDGKKCYSREFLLSLKSHPCSLCRPAALPLLDCIIDYARTQGNYSSQNRPYSNRCGSRTSQHDIKPRKIISTSLNNQISLHKSQDAWKPNKTELKENGEESMVSELCKKVRGILNKLTPENFDKLIAQLMDFQIDTDKKLKSAIDLVFEKAIDEPGFSVQYAKLCQKLAGLQACPGQKGVTFKKILLTKCQREFEKDKTDELKREEKLKEIKAAETELIKKQLRENLEEEERKSRRRSLGNIRFIGELFKLDMLTEFIMHECIKNLLQKKDEESLESLCRLLTTVGMKLESKEGAKSKKTKSKTGGMDTYFKEMKRIIDKKNTTSRVRFMLQDVLELKHRKWVPRRDESKPKTIDEIHQEMAQEEKEQQVLNQITVQSVQRRNAEPERVRKQNFIQNSSGWTSVGKSRVRMVTVERKKLEQVVSRCEEIKLQPVKEFTNWGSGCSGGANRQMNDAPMNKHITVKNRFNALIHNDSFAQEVNKKPLTYIKSGNDTGDAPIAKTDIPSQPNEHEKLLQTVKEPTCPILPILEDYSSAEEINDLDTVLLLQRNNLSEEEIEKRTKSLIDEFLVNNDFEDAVECVIELASPSTVQFVITTAVNQVLERSPQARHLLGQLMCHLIKNNVITLKHYVLGLQAVTELAEDYAIDIPMIWTYLGEIIEPTIDSVSIKCLKDLAHPLLETGTAIKLLAEVLHAVSAKRGPTKIYDLWKDSKMLLSDFLNPGESVEKFVEEYKLDFIMQPKETKVVNLPINSVKSELDCLLQKRNVPNEELVEWIDSNIEVERLKESTFIRTLVIAVIDSTIQRIDLSCQLDEKKLVGRAVVLQHYLDQQQQLELQALYAIQSLMCELKHPPSLLKHIFDVLYREDLISEETFKLWEASNDPAELAGKGVAVNSVHSFFTWLAKTDTDTSEIEPNN